MAEAFKIGDKFTVKKDGDRIELPDGGWLEPGQTYEVTYDKLEFVNRLRGKIVAGEDADEAPESARVDAGVGVGEMRKFRKEADPVDAHLKNRDDPERPDVPRAARNDASKRAK